MISFKTVFIQDCLKNDKNIQSFSDLFHSSEEISNVDSKCNNAYHFRRKYLAMVQQSVSFLYESLGMDLFNTTGSFSRSIGVPL